MKYCAIFAVLLCGANAFAQSDLHACKAEREVEQIYTAAKRGDRVKTLREGLAKYPDSLFLNQMLLRSPGTPPGALAAEYRAKLDPHPDSPLYLYLYGMSLTGKDSPKAIEPLRQSLDGDPSLAQAHLALLDIYSSQQFLDPPKVVASIRAYTAQCPDDIDVFRYTRQVEDPAALRDLTVMFRRALEKRNTIGVTTHYPDLWSAEFRIANPKDYDRLREQVRKDMDRIRQLDPNGVHENRSLANGYRLLGDAATADEINAKHAAAAPARTYSSVSNAWFDTHKDLRPAAESGELRTVTEAWVKEWPEESNAWYWRMLAIAWNKESSAAEIEKAGHALLDVEARNRPEWNMNPESLQVAELWEAHDIRLRDCIRMAREAMAEMDQPPKSYDDRRSIDGLAAIYNMENGMAAVRRFQAYGVIVRAERKLHDLPAADAMLAEMKSWLDGHPGDYTNPLWVYHSEAAATAEAENRKLDALAYYQKVNNQESKAHALDLWKEVGGSADTFDLFWTRPEAPKAPAPTPVWSEMDRSMAALNAPDLGGKTWTISGLKGKVTLINVWATWCGPCRDELPSVQKLYDQIKDRKDVQLITFATDANPGIVQAFVDRQKYTFPVVVAQTLADHLGLGDGVPQTWIVDTSGAIRAEESGFYPADWPGAMLARLNEKRYR